MERKVIIAGPPYGMHNIGDEAILESIVQQFSASAEITVMTYGSEWLESAYPFVEKLPIPTMYCKPFLGLTASPRKKIFSSIKNSFFPNLSHFANKDLFLCGGATILSDCPWHVLKLVQQASHQGVPSVFWAVGMAEVKDAETRSEIVKVCNSSSVDHIYTRDEFTQERLVRYGVAAEKVSVCYDAAYVLEGNPDSLYSVLPEDIKEHYEDECPNICISISGEADVTDQNHIKEIKKYIESVTEYANVFLVPTGLGSHCRDLDILKTLQINNKTFLIDWELTPAQLIAFLRNMSVIVSSRLHCSIFGANVGAPSINLIRNTKQEDFSKLFGLNALEMETLTSDKLVKYTNEVLSNRQELSESIRRKIDEIRKVHLATREQVIATYLKGAK